MAWQEQLEALGIDNSNMPNMIRKAVKDLYDFQNTLEKLQEQLEDDDLSERERGKIEEQVEVLEESIEEQESIVEKKIAQWEKNKDGYEARAEKLKAAAAAKRGTKVAKAQPSSEPTPAPAGVVVTPAAPPPQPPQPATDPAPKKKGGFGWIALGLVVAVLTAGAVIINKDE